MTLGKIRRAAFTLTLTLICALAGLTLTESPAEAFPILIGGCPPPCSTIDGFVNVGTCDRILPHCTYVCKVYRNTRTQERCYNPNQCYAL